VGKLKPGQNSSRENDTFAPVVQQVPGHFSHCPCGVGICAYGLWFGVILEDLYVEM